MTASISILPMTDQDWPAVRAIYEEGIATGNATFAPAAPAWAEWDAGHRPSCRFVARIAVKDGRDLSAVVGWAALAPVSSRAVYAGVAEVSVYVAQRARGQHVGSALLQALIESSEAEGIWTLQAGIFPENTASIELHKRRGFVIVGTRKRIGQMHGRWRDVVLMERRSEL
jgi:L-amino acid N-acyltransferase YncA